MKPVHHAPAGALQLIRPSARHWHSLDDDCVVGRGEAARRPDGRLFVSIDAWHADVFDALAAAMLAALPRPLHTVVDEADASLTEQWLRAGFAIRRREWEYVVPTDPRAHTEVRPPEGVTIVPVGGAEESRLRLLDRQVRDEIGATVGWQEMPAEVLPHPTGDTVRDPERYAVGVRESAYVALLRLVPLPRQPRVGLLAVRADVRRRGIGRALLADVLHRLHDVGVDQVSADVKESNTPAIALVEGFGAWRASSNLELVLR